MVACAWAEAVEKGRARACPVPSIPDAFSSPALARDKELLPAATWGMDDVCMYVRVYLCTVRSWVLYVHTYMHTYIHIRIQSTIES
jgi:hypothetical protein